MKNLLKIPLLVMAIVLVSSCEEKENILAEDETQFTPVKDSYVLGLLENLGFDVENYDVFENEDGFLVEDDLLIDHDQLVHNDEPETEQRRQTYKLDCKHFPIKLRVDKGVSKEWRDATIHGCEAWNKVSPLKDKKGKKKDLFKLVSKDEDVVIQNSTKDSKAIAATGEIKSDKKPSKRILLFKSLKKQDKRNRVMTHELGHILGFSHTNKKEKDSKHISGTEKTDSNSIMNATNAKGNKITSEDKKALKKLYEHCN